VMSMEAGKDEVHAMVVATLMPAAVASLVAPAVVQPVVPWTERTTAMFFELVFSVCPSPSLDQCTRIGSQCGWTAEEVAEWFSTRRYKWMFEGLCYQGLTMDVLVTIDPPFEVIWASDEWLNFCGFRDNEIVGKTLKLIQGPGTDQGAIDALMSAVARREVFTTTLLNYTKRGVPFYHTLTIDPLTDSQGQAHLFRAQSTSIVTCMQNAGQQNPNMQIPAVPIVGQEDINLSSS